MFNIYKKLINKLLYYFRAKDKRLWILDQITFGHYPCELNSVLNMVLAKNPLVSEKARVKLGLYASNLSVKQLVLMDECFRSQSYAVCGYYKIGNRYFKVKKFCLNSSLSFNKLKQLQNWSLFVGMASMLPNGLTREKAIKILSESDSGCEIPFLMLRLNDHVWQIRDLAAKIIFEKLSKRYLKIFIKYIEFIPRARLRSKVDKINVVGDLLDEIEHFISLNLSPILLKDIFRKSNLYTRRVLAKLAGSSNINPLKAYDIIKNNNDHIAKIEYWKVIKNVASKNDCINIAKQLGIDHNPMLRCEAIKYLVSEKVTFAHQFTQDCLFDKSSKVRWLARHFLIKNGLTNEGLRELCINKLKETGVSSVLIDILGELGNVKDIEFLLTFLDGKLTPLSKHAFVAIAKISPEVLDKIVIRFLISTPPIMLSTIRRFICKHIEIFKFEELGNIYFNSANTKVKKAILIISNYATKWEKIIFWLKALEEEEWNKITINSYIKRWLLLFNRTHCVMPSLSQIDEMNELMRKKFELLGPALVELINYALRSFKNA